MNSSIANNSNYLSQIGYVITLTDKYNNVNILHYLSLKYKYITRSVLASKLYGIAYRFDTRVIIKIMKGILGLKKLLHTIYTNSKLLYEYLINLGTT